jgi:hypothetical protein
MVRHWQFPGEDAVMRKEGNRLIIEPAPPKSLLAVLATLSRLTSLRAWRYLDSVKEGVPLRAGLYRVATNTSLESIFGVWSRASSETFQ